MAITKMPPLNDKCTRHTEGKWHDCNYVDQRNHLATKVERELRDIMRSENKVGAVWEIEFCRRFHAEMDARWKGGSVESKRSH